VLVEKVVGQLLGFPEYPGGPQYVSTSLFPKPPFPRSKFHTVVSGEPTVPLNSSHHCGTHVTIPWGSLETPAQFAWAWARPVQARSRNIIARRHLERHTKRTSIGMLMGGLFRKQGNCKCSSLLARKPILYMFSICSPDSIAIVGIDVEAEDGVDFNRLHAAHGGTELPAGQGGHKFCGHVGGAGFEDL
jgi:hypothetical protein